MENKIEKFSGIEILEDLLFICFLVGNLIFFFFLVTFGGQVFVMVVSILLTMPGLFDI